MGVRMPEFEKEVRKNYEIFLANLDIHRGTFSGPDGPPEGHPANMSDNNQPPVSEEYSFSGPAVLTRETDHERRT